jgi:hypothetical protein
MAIYYLAIIPRWSNQRRCREPRNALSALGLHTDDTKQEPAEKTQFRAGIWRVAHSKIEPYGDPGERFCHQRAKVKYQLGVRSQEIATARMLVRETQEAHRTSRNSIDN